MLLFAVGSGVYFFIQYDRETSQTSTEADTDDEAPAAPKPTTHIRLIATGDAIPHDAINKAAKTATGYSYAPMLANMKPVFAKADIRFCNQAVLGGGAAFGVTGYPSFNSPTEFARDLNGLGCNLVNTGSNHTNDKTQAVISSSVAAWDNLPNMLAIAGANRDQAEYEKYHYFTVKDVKFAFLSYTTYTNKPLVNPYSVTMFDPQLVQVQVSEARKQADIVIVSMRWGTEYSPEVNSAQLGQSQFLADLGADVVLGHGPHVLQPFKLLDNKDGRKTAVWYSLGNFLNAQEDAGSLFGGIAVIDIDGKTKKVEKNQYLPIYMHYDWPVAQKARGDLLARTNFSMHLLEDTTQSMIDAQQLKTTVAEQKDRIAKILNAYTTVPAIDSKTYYQYQ